MSTMSYSVNPTRCYFIKDFNDKVWRIVFTSFEGSSTGNIEFNKEEVTNSTYISDASFDISTFELYPNPLTSNNLNIVFDNSNHQTEIFILDITGNIVYNDIVIGSGFQTKLIDTQNFSKGLYIVTLNSKESTFKKKLIIQ